MREVSSWISRNIALIVLGVFVVALLMPGTFGWMPAPVVNPLLGVVMFGMGLTLKPVDFKIIFTDPRNII